MFEVEGSDRYLDINDDFDADSIDILDPHHELKSNHTPRSTSKSNTYQAIHYAEYENEDALLKRCKLGPEVEEILRGDIATCIAASSRLLAIGTKKGRLLVFSIHGHPVANIQPHAKAVTDVCILEDDSVIGSVSLDGTIVFIDPWDDGTAEVHEFPESPLLSLTIAWPWQKNKSFVFVPRDNGPSTVKKGFFGSKTECVHDTISSRIARFAPRESDRDRQLLAWASSKMVYVYDYTDNNILLVLDRPDDGNVLKRPMASVHSNVSLLWTSPSRLIVGWGDTIQILEIMEDFNRVKVSSSFSLPNHWVLGVSAMGMYVAVLGLRKLTPLDDERIRKTRLSSIRSSLTGSYGQTPDHREFEASVSRSSLSQGPVSVDTIIASVASAAKEAQRQMSDDPEIELILLSTSGIELSKIYIGEVPKRKLQTVRPKIVSSVGDNDKNLFYIIYGSKVVWIGVQDVDDVIDDLISERQYGRALQQALSHSQDLRRNTVDKVGDLYIEELLDSQEVEMAATMVHTLTDGKLRLWERWITKFLKRHAVYALVDYIPTSNPVLSSHFYDLILSDLLKHKHESFLYAVRRWPPEILNVESLIKEVEYELDKEYSSLLMEALTKLYIADRRYGTAMDTYNHLRQSMLGSLQDTDA